MFQGSDYRRGVRLYPAWGFCWGFCQPDVYHRNSKWTRCEVCQKLSFKLIHFYEGSYTNLHDIPLVSQCLGRNHCISFTWGPIKNQPLRDRSIDCFFGAEQGMGGIGQVWGKMWSWSKQYTMVNQAVIKLYSRIFGGHVCNLWVLRLGELTIPKKVTLAESPCSIHFSFKGFFRPHNEQNHLQGNQKNMVNTVDGSEIPNNHRLDV